MLSPRLSLSAGHGVLGIRLTGRAERLHHCQDASCAQQSENSAAPQLQTPAPTCRWPCRQPGAQLRCRAGARAARPCRPTPSPVRAPPLHRAPAQKTGNPSGKETRGGGPARTQQLPGRASSCSGAALTHSWQRTQPLHGLRRALGAHTARAAQHLPALAAASCIHTSAVRRAHAQGERSRCSQRRVAPARSAGRAGMRCSVPSAWPGAGSSGTGRAPKVQSRSAAWVGGRGAAAGRAPPPPAGSTENPSGGAELQHGTHHSRAADQPPSPRRR